MCGMAGFVGSGRRADLAAMTDALAHRGPDGARLSHRRRRTACFLGHRRLADHRYRRRRTSRCGTRTEPSASSSTAKSTITSSCGDELDRTRPSLCSRPLRYRSPGPWLRGVGRTCRPAQRHVRVRDLGPAAPPPVPGARPVRREAALITPGAAASWPSRASLRVTRHPRVDRTLDSAFPAEVVRLRLSSGASRALRRLLAKLPGGHSLTFDMTSDGSLCVRYWQFPLSPTRALTIAAKRLWLTSSAACCCRRSGGG